MANDIWQIDVNQAGTYKFSTGGKYVDRDIHAVVPQAAATVTLSGTATTPTIAKDATNSNVSMGTVTTTKPGSGYYVAAKATAPATTLSVTKTVNTAGYLGSNTEITASGATTAKTGVDYYVPITSAAATVTSSGTISTPSIAKGTGTVSAGSITTTKPSSGPYVCVTSSAAATTVTNTVNVGTAGYLGENSQITASGSLAKSATRTSYLPITAATVTAGTTTVGTTKGSDGNYSVTRGTFDIAEGYIGGTAGDLGAASFANAATSGTTYVDISETAASPVLVSDSGLYINKGYVDNLYISLAKLTPNSASAASSIKSGMLNSVSAYDNDGKLVTGNIATKTSTDVTASGKTVTVPAGYYASQVQKSVSDAGAATVNPVANTGAVTVGTLASGYYPLTNTISAESTHASAGWVTTTKETGSKSIQVGKIAASTTSKTDGTATASANTTHNLASGTYTTTATTGYTYHVDATASASTTAASVSASVGYVGSAVSASTAAASSGNKSSSVYLLDGVITNNTSGGTSTATINSGKQIKIAKGYYASDKYYTAQSFTSQAITGSLNSSITSGYTAPTLVDTAVSGTPYVTLTGNGSMTNGNRYNGTANAKTQYLEVYAGAYTVS